MIVAIHDRLVADRQHLRRIDQRARLSRFALLPLVVGSVLGAGYTIGALSDLGHLEKLSARFSHAQQELQEWMAKGQRLEEAFATQTSINSRIAKEVAEQAQEKATLQDRLRQAEQLLAKERKERLALEVLLGKAEQRLAGDGGPAHRESFEAETFPSVEETPEDDPANPSETAAVPDFSPATITVQPIEESELRPDDRLRLAADGTSLYTGRLDGQIAFARAPRRSAPPLKDQHIYVLVRWGTSSWIVTDGRATVSADGAVQGDFKVILPLNTIRRLVVTAIATEKVYRRYEHVRVPDYITKASTATIPVHRS